MAKLKVLESAEIELIGREFELQDEESWIGRAADAAVSIPDAAISRRHARIDRKLDGFFLVDNGSANGTFLNDQPVTRMALKEGDRIRIGRTLFSAAGLPDPEGTMILEKPRPQPVRAEEKATVVNYAVAVEPVREAAPPPPAPRPVPAPPPPRAAAPPPPARPAPPAVHPPAPAAPAPVAARPVPPPPAAAPSPRPPAPAPQPVPPPSAAGHLPAATLAGFWIRLAAYLIDSLILSVILVPVFFGLALLLPSTSTAGGVTSLYLLLQAVISLIGLAYVLYFWSVSGATPGKKALNLKIVRTDGVQPLGLGTAGMRLLGYFVSGFILWIGFLMIGFSSDKRGLHDKIAKTRVIRFGGA